MGQGGLQALQAGLLRGVALLLLSKQGLEANLVGLELRQCVRLGVELPLPMGFFGRVALLLLRLLHGRTFLLLGELRLYVRLLGPQRRQLVLPRRDLGL